MPDAESNFFKKDEMPIFLHVLHVSTVCLGTKINPSEVSNFIKLPIIKVSL